MPQMKNPIRNLVLAPERFSLTFIRHHRFSLLTLGILLLKKNLIRNPNVRASSSTFRGAVVGVRIGGQSAPAEASPAKDAKESAGDDDDDLDLFGDETEEEKMHPNREKLPRHLPKRKRVSGIIYFKHKFFPNKIE